MPATFEPIATTTLGSAASSIAFTSIPSTYTDLRVVLVGTADSSTAYIRFNDDSGSNYSSTKISGNGSTASSARNTSQTVLRFEDIDTSIPTLHTLDVFSYAGSTNKTSLATEANDINGAGTTIYRVNLWRSTSAITKINLLFLSGTGFASGATATLYGIKAA